jgi:hypothetical protein
MILHVNLIRVFIQVQCKIKKKIKYGNYIVGHVSLILSHLLFLLSMKILGDSLRDYLQVENILLKILEITFIF